MILLIYTTCVVCNLWTADHRTHMCTFPKLFINLETHSYLECHCCSVVISLSWNSQAQTSMTMPLWNFHWTPISIATLQHLEELIITIKSEIGKFTKHIRVWCWDVHNPWSWQYKNHCIGKRIFMIVARPLIGATRQPSFTPSIHGKESP